jgi:predicted transcriptional regulator of viral defense system
MKYETLLSIVGDAPVFESGLLLAGTDSPGYVRRQLSGWVNSGKLWQLRRGLYAVAPPYQKRKPHPFLVANRLVAGSYVSLHSALAHYGLIPEYVPVTTSVTTSRPQEREAPLGVFAYRHIQTEFFWGYRRVRVADGQHAAVAQPEKALLDLIYLQPGGDEPAYLRTLRLQNLDQVRIDTLQRFVDRFDKPKLRRASATLAEIIAEDEGYVVL